MGYGIDYRVEYYNSASFLARQIPETISKDVPEGYINISDFHDFISKRYGGYGNFQASFAKENLFEKDGEKFLQVGNAKNISLATQTYAVPLDDMLFYPDEQNKYKSNDWDPEIFIKKEHFYNLCYLFEPNKGFVFERMENDYRFEGFSTKNDLNLLVKINDLKKDLSENYLYDLKDGVLKRKNEIPDLKDNAWKTWKYKALNEVDLVENETGYSFKFSKAGFAYQAEINKNLKVINKSVAIDADFIKEKTFLKSGQDEKLKLVLNQKTESKVSEVENLENGSVKLFFEDKKLGKLPLSVKLNESDVKALAKKEFLYPAPESIILSDQNWVLNMVQDKVKDVVHDVVETNALEIAKKNLIKEIVEKNIQAGITDIEHTDNYILIAEALDEKDFKIDYVNNSYAVPSYSHDLRFAVQQVLTRKNVEFLESIDGKNRIFQVEDLSAEEFKSLTIGILKKANEAVLNYGVEIERNFGEQHYENYFDNISGNTFVGTQKDYYGVRASDAANSELYKVEEVEPAKSASNAKGK